MSVFIITSLSYLLINPHPTIGQFELVWAIYSIGGSYIDALAEGVTSVITKLNERLRVLKLLDLDNLEDDGDTSMKALGVFNSLRSFFFAIMGYVGGIVVQHSSLRIIALVMMAYPVLFIIMVIFVFREEKVNQKPKFYTQDRYLEPIMTSPALSSII